MCRGYGRLLTVAFSVEVEIADAGMGPAGFYSGRVGGASFDISKMCDLWVVRISRAGALQAGLYVHSP